MRKQLVFILVSAVFLAACTGPTPEKVELKMSDSKSSETSDEVLGSTTQNSNSYQLETTQLKGTMKQLSDFEPIEASQVTLTTTKGDITFELFRDKAPLTTLNFLNLAKSGFYDNIVFHRVIPDFMAQVGDPTTKEPGKEAQWGSGGPGYTIPDEFEPSLKHDSPGIVSMANTSEPNTGGSQIFITYEATPWLDGKHAVFGKVTSGMDVLKQITVGDKILSVSYK